MDNIAEFVNFISSIHPANLTDFSTLQDCLLKAGLNDEHLEEQPIELSQYFGTGYGLRIWQYPNQFVPYLLLLNNYKDKINSYLEIGSRYGGTFIFTNE
jgi:cephalosporin hydroxylase